MGHATTIPNDFYVGAVLNRNVLIYIGAYVIDKPPELVLHQLQRNVRLHLDWFGFVQVDVVAGLVLWIELLEVVILELVGLASIQRVRKFWFQVQKLVSKVDISLINCLKLRENRRKRIFRQFTVFDFFCQ